MKKVLTLVALGVIAVTRSTPVLSLEFTDEAAANAFFAEEAQAFQKMRENMEKGKTDSEALQEAIDVIFWLHLGNAIDDPILYAQNLMKEVGIPREQQIKTLEGIVREQLSAIEKNEKIATAVHIVDLLPMLEVLPDYDMLPILKECALSKNDRVRATASVIAKKNIASLEEKKQTADAEKFIAFITEVETGKIIEDEKPPVKNDAPIVPPPKIEVPEKPATEANAQSPSRTWLWGIGVCVVIVGGIAVWRKKL